MSAGSADALEPKLPEPPQPDALIRARTMLGEYELLVLTDGACRFDGGAMFGVVPKTLWSRRMLADEENCVTLGLNTVVVRTGTHTVVIETGLGDKLSAKQRAIYRGSAEAHGQLPSAFAAAGIGLEEVDIVINTHLHWDHCGWNTTRQPDGSLTPTFPNARYYAHRGEVEHGHRQLERDGVSYLGENYDPLIASGQMILLDLKDGEVEQIVPGISVELFPGHTRQLMVVHVDSGNRRACYISDLVPTSAHLDPTWVMSFDLDPLRTIEERKRFLARAIPEQWLVLFTHDHATPMGFIEIGEKGRPVLRHPA